MSPAEILQDLQALFPSPHPDDEEGFRDLLSFVEGADQPGAIAQGIRRLLKLADPIVAPAQTFLRRRAGTQFETWDFPVNVFSLIEIQEGRLLSLPPGSRRFSVYRSIIGEFVDRQLHTRFPRLLAELANRPNLFFPGVFFPHELEISNMEMISALHGTFYVVHAELWAGGKSNTASVVLKPTDMAVESIITFTLQFINRRLDPAVRRKIGPILAPTIVAIEDVYGMMDLMPGKNGVEFLPRGIKTGTLQDLRNTEYPPDLNLSRDDVFQIAREFAKQAVMAYYLRLYDRKPDQLMIHRGADGRLAFSHIDFGRALKRNYALPWKRHYDPSRPALNFDIHQIPFFESAGAFIYLPHFIPAALKDSLSPFDGELRRMIVETFTLLAHQVKASADEIYMLFKYLIGRQTQYKSSEVLNVCVEPEDVEEVYKSLLTLEDPAGIIESILNLAYHEREGTAAIHVEGEDDEAGIYRRALLSGERVTSLRDKPDGPHSYLLTDYHRGGRVSYDPEQKTLRIEFGDNPGIVVNHIDLHYSRRLAKQIRAYPGDLRGLEITVMSGGDVVVRMPTSDGRVGMARRIKFAPDIMREINEAGSGFSPSPHVMANAAEFRKTTPAADYLHNESVKESLILSNDLQGKEILQFVMAVEADAGPLQDAMSEAITYLLPNPDFLADLDPYEHINRLVVALGRKHLKRRWPTGLAMAESFLFADTIGSDTSAVRTIFSLYEPVDLSHHVHLILTVRFADELGRRANLPGSEHDLLLVSAALHDLNVLDPAFRRVLMEPSGRLSRQILTAVLERHAEISADLLPRALADAGLDTRLDTGTIHRLLKAHHRQSTGPTGRIQQILHLADNIAVFGDRTRPDHWIRGFLRLEEIAPRWLDAQLERKQIDREIWHAAQSFFSDPHQYGLLRRLDEMSSFYPQCYSALQMAAALHSGLNPQHPNPMADLRERHGSDLVSRIFDNLMKSGLPVRDKINVINRTDLIAPLFRNERIQSFAFINASAQPVQRVVEIIMRLMAEGRWIILMGMLPRVIKTYERLTGHPKFEIGKRDRVAVIAGERRLQFVTQSYPYEADFQKPFHVIIRDFRESNRIQDPCCLIPFEQFMSLYAPTAQAEERIRKLEKASDVEELRGSERVQAEAERYLKWEAANHHATFDDRSNERFRRILLSGFTNRDVLLFYYESVPGATPFRNALREVIGAMHENPNYLSDRAVYYNLQELVRSLGQIHFHADAAVTERNLKDFLRAEGLETLERRTTLLDHLKPAFNFVKLNLSSSIRIAVDLGRRMEAGGGTPISPEEWDRIITGILLCGSLTDDPIFADCILSPEDISSNSAVRRMLQSQTVSLAERIRRRPDVCEMLSGEEVADTLRLFDATPLQPRDVRSFLLIHAGLIFGAFCDFSKVENWRRGKIHIGPEDLEPIRRKMTAAFRRLDGISAATGRPSFEKAVEAFCRSGGADLLNDMAWQTQSHVRLFNALSLAAELRYGLSPRGFDLFHHVRTIFGSATADMIGEAIIRANFPLREKVKFARKLRMFATALTAEPKIPARLMILPADHPLTAAPVDEIQKILHSPTGESALIVPAGDYARADDILRSAETELKFMDQCKFLVGEDYPLLIKDRRLRHTESFREKITAWRQREGKSNRYIFVPARELSAGSDDAADAAGHDRGAGGADEKGLFSFRTWLACFD